MLVVVLSTIEAQLTCSLCLLALAIEIANYQRVI